MTIDEFTHVFGFLIGAYPKEVRQETFEAYRLTLADIDGAVVRKAVLRIIATSVFMPTVAEIRTACAEDALGLPDAESILDEIRKAIRDVGSYRNPSGLSPIAAAVVDTVGWQTLCASENPEADRAHIMRIASRFRQRAIEAGNLGGLGLVPGAPCAPVQRQIPSHVAADVIRGVRPPSAIPAPRATGSIGREAADFLAASAPARRTTPATRSATTPAP